MTRKLRKLVYLALAATFLLGMISVPNVAKAADPVFNFNEWNTTADFFVNRSDPHANFIAYDSEAAALANHTFYQENSAYYYTLNGDWKFHWAVNPAGRATEESIPGFTTLAFNDSGWDDMKVPHSWQVSWNLDAPERGYFKYDHVIYSNITYPWRGYGNSTAAGGSAAAPYYQDHQQGQAPKIFNPVGTYRKNFTIPQKWRDENRSVTLRFEGVESNVYVWVNGRAVGYGEDSFTTKEFDITDYVNYTGNNVVTVQIFRWSSGSFYEDQDFLRVAGIFRDVYLVGRSKVTLYDVDIITTPTIPDVYGEDWNLNVTSYIRSLEGATQAERDASTIEYKLYDAEGYLVKDYKSGAVPFAIVPANDIFANVNNRGKLVSKDYLGAEVNANLVISRPRQWSAEKPNLYKLVVTLKQGDKLIETTCFRVGFRESKIINVGNAVTTRWLINGSRILFYGTNVHETNPEGGRAMRSPYCTIDYITRDVQIMKANNVNAIRMSHYPHDRRFYELADEYGLYIMEEANIENHDNNQLQSNNTYAERFGPSLRDRINNMYERTKNFTSVISFSMGNENNSAGTVYADWNTNWVKDRLRGTRSGYGQADSAGWVNWITDPLRRDYRPIHAQFRNGEADMYSAMYTVAGTPGGTSGWASQSRDAGQNKPTVLCEYVHAMGNSNGDWDEYIAVYDFYPKTVGGFIWEWVDHSIWTPIPGNPTEKYMAYGGRWGERAGTFFNPGTSAAPHDGNFCNDGMLFPNREPRPQVQQMKHCYRMLTATLKDASTFTVTNKFLFTNANEFDQSWTLTENGVVIQSGKLNVNVGPAPTGVALTTINTADFAVPYVKPAAVKPGAEYFFNVYFADKSARPWAEAGHVISASQMAVTSFVDAKPVAPVATGAMSVDNGAAAVVVSGKDFEISISKANGAIVSYQFKGKSLLGTNPLAGQPAGPIPNFWRAPNDNEFGASGNLTSLNSWRVVGRNRTTTSVEVFESALFTRITVPGTFPDKATGSRYTTVYTIYPNGEVNVNYTYVFPSLTSNQYAHELGSMMTVNGAFNNLTWFGRGAETYSDRKTGSPIDIYQSTVEEQYTRYLQPIDTGNHVETRWLALTDDSGFGMIVKAAGGSAMPSGNSSAAGVQGLIEFNALYTTPEGLASNSEGAAPPARYNRIYYDVRWNDDICLRLNYMNTGVGGDQSWGALPLNQYRVDCSNRTFNYSYTILPVAAFDIDGAMAYSQTTYSDALALSELVATCESEWPDGYDYLDSAIAAAKVVLANAGSTRDAIADAYTDLYVKYVRSNWTAGISSPFTYSDDGEIAYNVSLSQFCDGTNQIMVKAQFDAASLEFVGSVPLFGGGRVTDEEYNAETGEYFARVMLLQQGELFTAPTETAFLKICFNAVNPGADLVASLTEVVVIGVITDIVADTVTCKLNPVATVTLYAPYDINGDRVISLEDISLIIYNFYGAIAGDSKWAAAQVYDVNGDGVIDIFDLMIIMTYIPPAE